MDEYNIKMDLKHKAYVGADWIHLVHDSDFYEQGNVILHLMHVKYRCICINMSWVAQSV
jgi:hypothetical protein